MAFNIPSTRHLKPLVGSLECYLGTSIFRQYSTWTLSKYALEILKNSVYTIPLMQSGQSTFLFSPIEVLLLIQVEELSVLSM